MAEILTLVLLLSCSLYTSAQRCDTALFSSSKVTASSSLSSSRGPDQARLHGTQSWTAKDNNFHQYLEINLRDIFNLTAIETQGRVGVSSPHEFVTEYNIHYSEDYKNWKIYSAPHGMAEIFQGNENGNSVFRNPFSTPIIARYIRIIPTRWSTLISMRVEIYGCPYLAVVIGFNGYGIMKMKLDSRPIWASYNRIRFRMKTYREDAVLMYSRGSQGDYFSLFMQNGRLFFHLDLGSGYPTRMSVGSLIDDNQWHDVDIIIDGRKATFMVDRVESTETVKGDYSRLNLDQEFYIGGVENYALPGVVERKNYTGCLENIMFNNTNILYEYKQLSLNYFQKIGEYYWDCVSEQVIPVTFPSSETFIKLPGFENNQMNVSFDFRSFQYEQRALMMYNKIHDGYVKVLLDRGFVKVEIMINKVKIIINGFQNGKKTYADGLWHRLNLVIKNNSIVMTVDQEPSVTTRLLSIRTSTEYLIGGGLSDEKGFIGCMRFIDIDGSRVNILSIRPEDRSSEVLLDSCNMIDRCHPNPCEHDGVCRQSMYDFFCDCVETGYGGAVCRTSMNSLSCEEYRQNYPRSTKAEIQIDIDGSGLWPPFPVVCEFTGQVSETQIGHKNMLRTSVNGFQLPGSFSQDIIYNANMDVIAKFVNRSNSCRQSIKYNCRNSKLLNSPDGPQYSWWVSRTNQMMDSWGGASRGSRKCSCGLNNACIDQKKWCNCDSALSTWQADEGDITEKDYLPVRQLRFGDTGTVNDDKEGSFELGPLKCIGDSLFDNVVTFWREDAILSFPPFSAGQSGDIYFQFKTTAENAVILSNRGPTDYIKVLLVGGDEVQFLYDAGNGPKIVAKETSSRLNDDRWHSVQIERNRKEARIRLDGSLTTEIEEAEGPFRALQLIEPLFVGGSLDTTDGFVGCLRSLMINGELLDMRSQAEQGVYGVRPGCVGKCSSNPCMNNGTCLEKYSKFGCDCRWTAFRGPLCSDEIGTNMQPEDMVIYTFSGTLTTIAEKIRVAFTTTYTRGILMQITSHVGEYFTLELTNSGALKITFDYGFDRQEFMEDRLYFPNGQHHDIRITRRNLGSLLVIYVDNYPAREIPLRVGPTQDAQFNNIKKIYIGKNETVPTSMGFIGCISRVQFEDFFILKQAFQENPPSNVWKSPRLREDWCNIEPPTHPPEVVPTRMVPIFKPEDYSPSARFSSTDSAVLGGVLAIIFLALIGMIILISRYMARQKGEYKTHEDKGAKDAPDADTAIAHGATGQPDIAKKKEWFI